MVGVVGMAGVAGVGGTAAKACLSTAARRVTVGAAEAAPPLMRFEFAARFEFPANFGGANLSRGGRH